VLWDTQNVQRARAREAATVALIPPLELAERRATYRLAVLLGQRPGTLDDELQPADVPTYAKALPIGDPAQLLRRRPDVRAAERQLKSLVEQADASQRAAALAELQYREGLVDFLTLLDAQRTQLEAEDALAQAQTQVNVDVIAVYKAMGGVGQPPSEPLRTADNE